ncbi:MAG: DUF4190 domain-containing protein [Phycisphaerales bacterium JB043]
MTHESYPPEYPSQNNIGITGFVVSLLGIFTLGILSPIGFIISMMGLTRAPRGFAIAGVIIGLIGSIELFAVILIVTAIAGAGLMVFLMFMGFKEFGVEGLETFADSAEIVHQIVLYEKEHNALPASIDDLALEEKTLTDYWGNPYIITLDTPARRMTITTYGEDGQPDGDTDTTLSLPIDFLDDDPDWEGIFQDDRIEIIRTGDDDS